VKFTSKEDLAAQALAQALAPAPREPGAAPDLAGFVAQRLGECLSGQVLLRREVTVEAAMGQARGLHHLRY
jgi:hypothetical protein